MGTADRLHAESVLFKKSFCFIRWRKNGEQKNRLPRRNAIETDKRNIKREGRGMTRRNSAILERAEKLIKDNENYESLFFIEQRQNIFVAYCYEGRKIAEDSNLENIMQKCREFSKNKNCHFLIDDMTV